MAERIPGPARKLLFHRRMTSQPSPSALETETPVQPSPDNERQDRPVTLIANDQEWSARSVESVLTPRGVDVVRAHTGEQALLVAREAQPDLIILDAQMPDLHGFEVCRMLRADPRIGPTRPIFITTSGPAGRRERLAAYRAGAWEFFPEPLDLELFLARFDSALHSSLASRQLERARLIDPRTGLYSAEGLEYRARQLQSEAARRQQDVACLVFRADGLPAAEAADADARRLECARALRRVSRESDAVGELGPCEFAVVASGVNRQRASSLVLRYRAAVEQLGAGVDGMVTSLSAGIATLRPHPATPVDVVPRARAALDALRTRVLDDGSNFEFSLG